MTSALASRRLLFLLIRLGSVARPLASSSSASSSSLVLQSSSWPSTIAAFSNSCIIQQGIKTKMAPDSPSLPNNEEEWKLRLTSEQFRILREKGTEMAGTGIYNNHSPTEGIYECAGCSAPLYRFDHKFKSGCGWPAFFDAFPGAVNRHEDRAFGMVRTEITCSRCGGHLGHVFKGEGYSNPTNERHCVNSVSIKFNDKVSADEVPQKD